MVVLIDTAGVLLGVWQAGSCLKRLLLVLSVSSPVLGIVVFAWALEGGFIH